MCPHHSGGRRVIQAAQVDGAAGLDIDDLAVLARGAAEPAARAVPDDEPILAGRERP